MVRHMREVLGLLDIMLASPEGKIVYSSDPGEGTNVSIQVTDKKNERPLDQYMTTPPGALWFG
jgi:hypothetical protein